MNLKLDMSRGKPGADQLDLSMLVMDELNAKSSVKAADGTDCRNYGVLDGIRSLKPFTRNFLKLIPRT
jgi:hypothetical protein